MPAASFAPRCPASPFDDPVALADGQNLVDINVGELFNLLRGRPLHFNQIDLRRLSDAKVQAQIALGHHAGSAVDLVHLPVLADGHIGACAKGCTIALRSDQLELDPVVLISAIIAQQRRRIVHVADDNVDVAVVCRNRQTRTRGWKSLVNSRPQFR